MSHFFSSLPAPQKETSSALTHAGAHLDLSAFSSWEVSCESFLRFNNKTAHINSAADKVFFFFTQELASLGLDRLKSALMALGLKCGG